MIDAPMFLATARSKRRLSIRSLRRRIDSYLKSAGLKRPGLSAHSMRRTAATLMAENGATLLELQQLLDHANADTTIQYIARLQSLKNRVSEKFPVTIK